MNESPFLLIKALEIQLTEKLRSLDLFALDKGEQKLVLLLRRDMTDARLDARDYELSETRAEQLKKAKAGKNQIEKVRKGILAVSEYNVFSAIDVAQLTAQLERISLRLV